MLQGMLTGPDGTATLRLDAILAERKRALDDKILGVTETKKVAPGESPPASEAQASLRVLEKEKKQQEAAADVGNAVEFAPGGSVGAFFFQGATLAPLRAGSVSHADGRMLTYADVC
jgi:hypothetical protein